MQHPNPFTITIADDDDDDRELFQDLFQRDERFTLLSCLNSGRAVFDDIIRQKKIPDVLLVDMYMPFFTGVDVVNALEKMDVGTTMYKFVTSTLEYIPELEPLSGNPYIVFIKKPVTTKEIDALPGIMLHYLEARMHRAS